MGGGGGEGGLHQKQPKNALLLKQCISKHVPCLKKIHRHKALFFLQMNMCNGPVKVPAKFSFKGGRELK